MKIRKDNVSKWGYNYRRRDFEHELCFYKFRFCWEDKKAKEKRKAWLKHSKEEDAFIARLLSEKEKK